MSGEVLSGAERKMARAIEAMERDFTGIRTGRASTSLVERIHVDYYGTQTPLNQVATLNAPEPRLLVIQPYDRSAMANIEKAIQKSDLGLTPNNDGKVIRIPIPALTQERRQELVKHVKKIAEEFRVSVRNHRHAALEKMKEAEKKKEITEDVHKHGKDRVEKITKDFIDKVDQVLKVKENEIMEV